MEYRLNAVFICKALRIKYKIDVQYIFNLIFFLLINKCQGGGGFTAVRALKFFFFFFLCLQGAPRLMGEVSVITRLKLSV